MLKSFSALCCYATAVAAESLPRKSEEPNNHVDYEPDTLDYVFAFSRHGARSLTKYTNMTYFADDLAQFSVGAGLLTPSGMRQRYLKGRYNRDRWVTQHGLLSESYEPREIYLQSTYKERTMESAYAEMMGLYPPQVSESRDAQINMSRLSSEVWMPPFNVRDSTEINSELGQSPLPYNFTALPAFNVEKSNIENFRPNGCPIVGDEIDEIHAGPSKTQHFLHLVEGARDPIGAALGLPQDVIEAASVLDMHFYSDVIICSQFEGLDPVEWTFTEETYHEMHLIQAIVLGQSVATDLNTLYISKLFDTPMQVLRHKANALLGKQQGGENRIFDDLKVFMYDGHDTQAVGILYWLKPSNLELPHPTVYATQISVELLHSQPCLDERPGDETCLAVQVLLNGEKLEFENQCERADLCTYTEFLALLEQKWQYGDTSFSDWENDCKILN